MDWNISLSKYNLNNCIVFQGNVLSWLALYASLKWCYSNRSRKSEYIKILKTYVLKISLGNKNTRNLSYTKLCIDKINALWLIQKVDQKHYMLDIFIYHCQIFISYKYICSSRNEHNKTTKFFLNIIKLLIIRLGDTKYPIFSHHIFSHRIE